MHQRSPLIHTHTGPVPIVPCPETQTNKRKTHQAKQAKQANTQKAIAFNKGRQTPTQIFRVFLIFHAIPCKITVVLCLASMQTQFHS